MDGVAQIEMLDHRGGVGGIVVHVVAVRHLARAAVAAAVMRDDAIAMLDEEQHLRVPVVGAQRPAMVEHDRLALAPVLVEDLGSVLCLDIRHGDHSCYDFPSSTAEICADCPLIIPHGFPFECGEWARRLSRKLAAALGPSISTSSSAGMLRSKSEPNWHDRVTRIGAKPIRHIISCFGAYTEADA